MSLKRENVKRREVNRSVNNANRGASGRFALFNTTGCTLRHMHLSVIQQVQVNKTGLVI